MTIAMFKVLILPAQNNVASAHMEYLIRDRLRSNGYLAMGGQIVDATLVTAPKQRNTQDEKDTIKTAKEVWPDELAKAA